LQLVVKPDAEWWMNVSLLDQDGFEIRFISKQTGEEFNAYNVHVIKLRP